MIDCVATDELRVAPPCAAVLDPQAVHLPGGVVAGSDKRIAFRAPYDPALDWAAVFEAPIDLMSWFTLYGKCNAIALCGLYDGPLETYLDDHPHVRRIVLC